MYHFEFIRGVTLKVTTKYFDSEKIHGYSWVINPTIQTKPISLNFFLFRFNPTQINWNR